MSDATSQPTPTAIAAAIGAMEAPALRELAGRLVHELAQQRAATVDEAEVKRRVGLIVVTAPAGDFGRTACPLCGALSNADRNLRRHLLRVHGAEIAGMPPERFQRRGA